MKKRQHLTLVFACLATFAFSQDTIILKSGKQFLAYAEYYAANYLQYSKPGSPNAKQGFPLDSIAEVRYRAMTIARPNYYQGELINDEACQDKQQSWIFYQGIHEYIAQVDSCDLNYLYLKTASGDAAALLRHKVRFASKPALRETWQTWHDPTRTRGALQPTAFGLNAGEILYSNTGLLANQLHIGLTNFLTVSGGVAVLPGVMPDDRARFPVWARAHLSLPLIKNKLTLGAGGITGAANDGLANFNMLYTNLSLGTPLSHLTLSAGFPRVRYIFESGRFINYIEGDVRLLTLGLSAASTVNPQLSILTDNSILKSPGGRPIFRFSAGARYRLKWFSILTVPGLRYHQSQGTWWPSLLLGADVPLRRRAD